MIKIISPSFIVLVSFVLSCATNAQTYEKVKTTDHWEAYKSGSGKGRFCFVGSEPIKETGAYKRRDKTYILVTHRPNDRKNKVDIFELVAGYTYKKDSGVIIKIGSQTFELFTSGGTAWAKTSKTDRALARAMKRGNTMTVAGTSSRGTKTLDTYSLKGFTAAYNAIGTNCRKK